jgi:hypothetical protein
MRKSYHERLVEKNRQEIEKNKKIRKRFYMFGYVGLFSSFAIMVCLLDWLWPPDKFSVLMLLALASCSFQTGAMGMYVFIQKLVDRDFSNDAEIYWKKSIQQIVTYDEDFLRKHQTGAVVCQTEGKAL